MADLSPAAQAVLDAFENASDGQYVEGVWVVNERTMLSAALRAAADQVVPECREYYPNTLDERYRKVSVFDLRNKFLAIAAELRAQ